MIIAADIIGSEEYRHFIYESFKIITAQYPQHSFIFIFDKPFNPSFVFSKNIIPVVVKPQKISLMNEYKISSLLKKYKADVFVTGEILSQTKVHQCLIAWNKVSFKFFKKAQVIVMGSDFSRKEIREKYKIDQSKIDIVYKGTDKIFQPIDVEEKEKIKKQYSNNNEYFLFAGTVQQDRLLNLLKAFSVFKKMQKSNMQLLLVPKRQIAEELLEALRLYKFKSEVKVLENIDSENLAAITSAAYAFVYPSEEYSDALPAIQSGVPVITTNENVLHEIFADAAVYFNSSDHKSIADKMMLIYKDEKLRQQLIDNGKEQVKKYSWDKTADSLWKSIEKACL